MTHASSLNIFSSTLCPVKQFNLNFSEWVHCTMKIISKSTKQDRDKGGCFWRGSLLIWISPLKVYNRWEPYRICGKELKWNAKAKSTLDRLNKPLENLHILVKDRGIYRLRRPLLDLLLGQVYTFICAGQLRQSNKGSLIDLLNQTNDEFVIINMYTNDLKDTHTRTNMNKSIPGGMLCDSITSWVSE